VGEDGVEVLVHLHVEEELGVGVVEMRQHSEQVPVHLAHLHVESPVEIVCVFGGKQFLIGYGLLAEGHDVIDVLGRGALQLLAPLLHPRVIRLARSLHQRAGFRGAVFRDGSVYQVDVVEQVDRVGGDPLPNINMHGFGYQGDEVDVRRSRGNEPVLQVDLLLLDDRLLLVVLLAVPHQPVHDF